MSISPINSRLLILLILLLSPSFLCIRSAHAEPANQQRIPQQQSIPSLQSSAVYHDKIKVQHYLVSEKLDGIRGYWDGSSLQSRQGNAIQVPHWFVRGWPNTPMDGEIWSTRGNFEAISSCVRSRSDDDACWQKLTFQVFDLPTSTAAFEQRYQLMQKLIAKTNSSFLHLIHQRQVESNEALQTLLERLVTKGAEGLMLHHKKARYRSGKNSHLLKLKTYHDDEAVVLRHVEGKGKYSGMMGAMWVKNNEGVQFKIGTGFSDEQRRFPPAIGATVTYKFFGKTKKNVPRFASFLRVRSEPITPE